MRYFFVFFYFFLVVGCSHQGPRALKSADDAIMFSEKTKTPPAAKPEMTNIGTVINPFLSEEEQKLYASVSYRQILDLNLTAIFYRSQESRAIIDGTIFKLGDLVDNKQIVQITPAQVILKDQAGEYVVRLNTTPRGEIK